MRRNRKKLMSQKNPQKENKETMNQDSNGGLNTRRRRRRRKRLIRNRPNQLSKLWFPLSVLRAKEQDDGRHIVRRALIADSPAVVMYVWPAVFGFDLNIRGHSHICKYDNKKRSIKVFHQY